MADDISTVIDSLDTLRDGTIKAGIEFKGFAKSITSAASGTEGASKSWTTFSRLVSGTPIWAMQNKIRAYLSILGGFETRSKANAKASTEEQKKMMLKIKGYDKLNKVMYKVNTNGRNLIKYGAIQSTDDKKYVKEQELKQKLLKREANMIAKKNHLDNATKWKLKHAKRYKKERNAVVKAEIANALALKSSNKRLKDMDNLMHDIEDSTMEALKSTEQFQKVFQATGNEEKAMQRAIQFYRERHKEIAKEELAIKKVSKIAYAFDNDRIKDAGKLAKIKNADRGGGKIKGFFASRKAKNNEKFQQRKDRRKVTKGRRKDASRGAAKGVTDNLESAKMLLAPLLVITKTVALAKAALLFNSEGAQKARGAMYDFILKLQPMMSILFKYLIMGMLAIAGFFVILVFLKRYYEILKEFGVIDEIKQLGNMAFDFLKTGWKMVSAFLGGDYTKALDYLGIFIDQGIAVAIATAKVLAKMTWFALVAGFDLLMDAAYKFYKDPEFREKIMGILLKVGMIVVTFIIIQFLIGLALSLLAAAALPILFGVVVLAALFTVAYWLNKKFDDYYQGIEDSIADFFHMLSTLKNDIINAVIKIKDDIIYSVMEFLSVVKDYFNFSEKAEKTKTWLINKITNFIKWIIDKLKAIQKPAQSTRDKYNKTKDSIREKGFINTITGKAHGGTSHGGLTMVGELGPELVKLPAGAQVKTNNQTAKMMSKGTTNINITINAKDTSKAEMRRIANELGNMINNKMNRSGSHRTMG